MYKAYLYPIYLSYICRFAARIELALAAHRATANAATHAARPTEGRTRAPVPTEAARAPMAEIGSTRSLAQIRDISQATSTGSSLGERLPARLWVSAMHSLTLTLALTLTCCTGPESGCPQGCG